MYEGWVPYLIYAGTIGGGLLLLLIAYTYWRKKDEQEQTRVYVKSRESDVLILSLTDGDWKELKKLESAKYFIAKDNLRALQRTRILAYFWGALGLACWGLWLLYETAPIKGWV